MRQKTFSFDSQSLLFMERVSGPIPYVILIAIICGTDVVRNSIDEGVPVKQFRMLLGFSVPSLGRKFLLLGL